MQDGWLMAHTTQLLLFTLTGWRSYALSWVRFDAPPPTNAATTTQRYPLYPLRATYMPCGAVELRNTEPRNVRMCREAEYFVASLLHADGASCAEVGTLLRIDGVENATRDNTGQVLARPRDAPRALRVRCTAVGRRRLVGIRNGDAYFDAGARLRGEFLVGEFEAYEDEEPTDTTPDNAASALAFLARSLQGDERNVVEEAAALATAETSWEALELWQRYCATRLATAAADARADRDELLIDAALRRGGAITVPVDISTLPPDDRRRILENDERAADALEQLEIADAAAFQALLEERSATARLAALAAGALREGSRLAQRAALQRAFAASP